MLNLRGSQEAEAGPDLAKTMKNADEGKTESLWVDGIKTFFSLSTENLSDHAPASLRTFYVWPRVRRETMPSAAFPAVI
jgi:hypothetical protein